ncbi:serine/threonine protein kinase [Rubellimicrobium arenae]|uniref:serine/threonine protein kinase n=1 Tax=Rubellimicrobium arenae TaxID=2817372 RepID=UPI001B31053D|nr:serine/threonine protein kinase [Rubellimicrobium arenae]
MIQPLPTDIFHQGQVLNNTYEIEGVLGRGGTGEVYRARNLVSGRIVAVKALARQFSGNEDYIELMRREEQMRDIAHDAVVRYTECSRSDDGNVFLVMDFIDGPSLFDELRRRRFDPRELLIVGHRVAEGLAAAHRRGIVHRDLSPDNVVLRGGEPERATIIDFGIAKDTTPGARTIVGNDFAGKYEYAAPEQLEGQADARSDLYALGASLLAAWRGEVPFVGTTPGEIVRRKRLPLDTEGLPQPLKGLIDKLSAPAPGSRPASATEALADFENALRLGRGARPAKAGGQRTGRKWGLVAAGLLVIVLGAGGGLWRAGMLDGVLQPDLPEAVPYRLTASVLGGPILEGNAPDAEASLALRQAFGAIAGQMPPEVSLVLARGVPSEAWPGTMAAMIEAAAGLEDWTLEAEGSAVHLSGFAPDTGSRDRLAAALTERASEAGLSLDLDLRLAPRLLRPDQVIGALAPVATCGSMGLIEPPEDAYGPADRIRVTGDVAAAGDEVRIREALDAVAGDRPVQLEASVLNADLCAIRALLPTLPSAGMSIRFSDGATGGVNLSGIYSAGANPVVEVELPATVRDGWLWVILVDNTGKVFNLLPNISQTEHRIAELGTVENGIRRIPVLHSIDEFSHDNTKLAFRISAQDFGKSEVIAFLSREPLFSVRRPRDESVASFAEALAGVERNQPGNLTALAARVLEGRP